MNFVEKIRQSLFKASLPESALERYQEISDDLTDLANLLGPFSGCILDACSGSGAGSIALTEVFPGVKVEAIDDNSSHQEFPEYQTQNVIPGVSFHHASIQQWQQRSGRSYDAILLTQYPLLSDSTNVAKEDDDVNNLRALGSMLTAKGTLLIGYRYQDSLAMHRLWDITQSRDVFPTNSFQMTDISRQHHHHLWLKIERN